MDLLSTTAAGAAGSLISENPQLSRNGRYVAFQSRAEDLAMTGAADGNGRQDVFVRDLVSGGTTLISVNLSGRSGSGDSWGPSISDDGRFIAFASFADDLIKDVSYLSGVNAFVRDRDVDADGVFDEPGDSQTYLLSRSGVDPAFTGNGASGGIALGASYALRPVISGNGRVVVFGSLATNLLDTSDGITDPFPFADLYYATPGRDARLISVNADGISAGVSLGGQSAGLPSVSASGSRVAFQSADFDLVDDDTEGVQDVFVRDLTAGRTRRISVNNAGRGGNDVSFEPVISRNGRHVIFGSRATNLVDDDSNGVADLFVHDLLTSRTALISRSRDPLSGSASGNLATPPSIGTNEAAFAISDSGRYVVFSSLATDLLDPAEGITDTNLTADVFWYDRDADSDGIFDETAPGATLTKLVSINAAGTATASAPPATGGSNAVTISGDGRFVLLTSPGTDLVDGGTTGTAFYVRDMFSETTSLIALTGTPGALFAGVSESALDTDPLQVAFASVAAGLDPTAADGNSTFDVFGWDAPTNIVAGAVRGDGGTMLKVGFRIENKPVGSPFEAGVYRSADGIFDASDELLDTFLISGSSLLVGSQSLLLPIGPGPGEISLPGAGTSETDEDYQLLVVLDHLQTIAEFDDSSVTGDNTARIEGIYHLPGGPVFAHGRAGSVRKDDVLTVTETETTLTVRLNRTLKTYALGDVSAVRFRGHEGDDAAQGPGTPDLLIGGAGDDKLLGGGGDDFINGGAGDDTLSGEAGYDTIVDGMGDDTIDLGPDGGVVIATPGSSDWFLDGGGNDVLDFSRDDRVITLDADSVAVQTVDADGNTVQLTGFWERLVGSPAGNTFQLLAGMAERHVTGGLGFDRVLIDADGRAASRDGAGNVSIDGRGTIHITGIEDIRVINSTTRIIDDSHAAGFSHTGFFDSNPNFPQGFAGGVKFSAAGSGNTATWTFSDLAPGLYSVAATWTHAGDRAKDAPWTLRNGGAAGTIAGQVDINQEVAPNDFAADGFSWEMLGHVLVTGNQLTVQLTDVGADQFVTADAVRIEPIGTANAAVNALDDGGPQFRGDGSQIRGPGLLGGQHQSPSGTGATVGTWVTAGMPAPAGFAAGDWLVSAIWGATPAAATDTPFVIGNGSTEFTTRVSQQVVPDDFHADGVVWERLGVIRLDEFDDLVVRLQDDASGSVLADAIRLDALPDVILEYIDPRTGLWIPVSQLNQVNLGAMARDMSGNKPVSIRFAVRNQGPGGVALGEVNVTGPGFSLVSPVAAGWLNPGNRTVFDVIVQRPANGTFVGTLMIPTSDFRRPLLNPEITVSIVDDSVPPTVQITAPTDRTLVLEGLSLPIRAEVTDDMEVLRVDFLVNGQTVVDTQAPFEFDFQLTPDQLPPGELNVQVTAFDLQGNSSQQAKVVELVLDEPPRVTLLSPPNNANPLLEAAQFPLSVTAEDDLQIQRVELVSLATGTVLAETRDFPVISIPQQVLNGPLSLIVATWDVFGRRTESNVLTWIPEAPLSFRQPVTFPSSMQTADPRKPLIRWNPLPGAQAYDLFIRNLRTQQFRILNDLEMAEVQLLASLDQGLHRIWVRGIDDQGQRSEWSLPYSFLVNIPQPPESKPVFTVTSPGIDPTPEIRLLNPGSTDELTDLAPGETLEVFIRDRTAPQQPDVVIEGTYSQGLEVPIGRLADNYGIWVRRRNAAGETGPWSDAVSHTITTPVPTAVVATGPSGVHTTVLPQVTWDAVNFADRYSVLVRRIDRTMPDLHDQHVRGLSWDLPQPFPNGEYRVWVRARTAAGVGGPWSDPLQFTVNIPIPAQVILTGPSGLISQQPIVFQWQPLGPGTRYTLWLNRLDTNERPLLVVDGLRDGSFTPAVPMTAGSYRFWVQAISGNGFAGPWSAPLDFEITTAD